MEMRLGHMKHTHNRSMERVRGHAKNTLFRERSRQQGRTQGTWGGGEGEPLRK